MAVHDLDRFVSGVRDRFSRRNRYQTLAKSRPITAPYQEQICTEGNKKHRLHLDRIVTKRQKLSVQTASLIGDLYGDHRQTDMNRLTPPI